LVEQLKQRLARLADGLNPFLCFLTELPSESQQNCVFVRQFPSKAFPIPETARGEQLFWQD
jgi:hypothetical protein